MSMTPEERKARQAEQSRRHYEANKESVRERSRQYRKANKEAMVELDRRWFEANKEARAEKGRLYREANKEARAEKDRQYRKANKEARAERQRRYTRQYAFTKEDGSSFRAWTASLYRPSNIFAAIANLTPKPGQTLAQLIHELSGYAMEVCEQIANPTVIEDSPALTPPAAPDLF